MKRNFLTAALFVALLGMSFPYVSCDDKDDPAAPSEQPSDDTDKPAGQITKCTVAEFIELCKTIQKGDKLAFALTDVTDANLKQIAEALKNLKSLSKAGETEAFCSVELDLQSADGALKTIPAKVFEGCEVLSAISLPTSVVNIEESAFSGCASLAKIDISEGVKEIGASAFAGCAALKAIEIPATVTTVGESAFQSCSSLATVTIPESVKEIGQGAFSSCESLATIIAPESVHPIIKEVIKDEENFSNINICEEKPEEPAPEPPYQPSDTTQIPNVPSESDTTQQGIVTPGKPSQPSDTTQQGTVTPGAPSQPSDTTSRL